MSNSADTLRQARARELTLTLRTLQRRLNQTIDELSELVAGEVVDAESAHAVTDWGPALFALPLAEPVHLQPSSGLALGPGASFYVGEHHGVLQLLQFPIAGLGASTYACCINFADFDGEWMSLVFDLRSLLEATVPGRMQLLLWAEHDRVPAQALQVKCSWRTDGSDTQATQARVEAGEPLQLVLDLGWLQPASLKAFSLHLIFPAAGRGSISVRHLRASLQVLPAAAVSGGQDVFEDTP